MATASNPAGVVTATATSTPPSPSTITPSTQARIHPPVIPLSITAIESLLHRALSEINKTAKLPLPLVPDPEPNNANTDADVQKPQTHEIAVAKMLNYCIRMLHADGWHPPTIIRAMALRESGVDRGMRGMMYQALRERRRESGRIRRAREMEMGLQSAGEFGTDVGQVGYGNGTGAAISTGSSARRGGRRSGSGRATMQMQMRHSAPADGNYGGGHGAGAGARSDTGNGKFVTGLAIANGAVGRDNGDESVAGEGSGAGDGGGRRFMSLI